MRALAALLLLALCCSGCSDAWARGLGPRRATSAATYSSTVHADDTSLIRYFPMLDGAVANGGTIAESSGFTGGPFNATTNQAYSSVAAIVTGDASALDNFGGGSGAQGTFTTTGNLADFSACFWYKLPTPAVTIDYQLGILSSGACSSGNTMIWGHTAHLALSFDGSNNVVADTAAQDTALHFACFVRTSNSLHLWVDNVDVANATNSTSAVFVRFGGPGCGAAKEVTLSEIEIHNAALSSARIGARWTAGQ